MSGLSKTMRNKKASRWDFGYAAINEKKVTTRDKL